MKVKQVFYTSNTFFSITHLVCGGILFTTSNFVLGGIIFVLGILHLFKKLEIDGESPIGYNPFALKLSLALSYLLLIAAIACITTFVYFNNTNGFVNFVGVVSFLFLTYHSIFDFKYYGD